MATFIFRYFKNSISHKSVCCFILRYRRLTICCTVSFFLLFGIQIASMIVGSVKLRHWSRIPVAKFHSVYLVYMILSWSFLAVLIIATMICMSSLLCLHLHIGMIVYNIRLRKANRQLEPLLDDISTENTCCCGCHRKHGKLCCPRCHHCCMGGELDEHRKRVNNSCCCNGCCPCCIDCCVDCCGDKLGDLPEGVTEQDIVYASPSHRVIYYPDPNAPAGIYMNHSTSSMEESFAGLNGVGQSLFRTTHPATVVRNDQNNNNSNNNNNKALDGNHHYMYVTR